MRWRTLQVGANLAPRAMTVPPIMADAYWLGGTRKCNLNSFKIIAEKAALKTMPANRKNSLDHMASKLAPGPPSIYPEVRGIVSLNGTRC